MRTVKWKVLLSGLCAWLVLGVVASGGRADVTSEKTASILIFPKVISNAGVDTVIRLVNTSNSLIQVHCNYVDARLFDTVTGLPCERPSLTCVPLWQETNFDLWLTRQQPTHWSVANGRRVDPTDGFGVDGSGFDPGHIPPKPDFEGELKCVEVSPSGEPVAGNHLRGEVVVLQSTGDLARYSAIGIEANPDLTPSNPLVLDGDVYAACPEKLWLNHDAQGSRGSQFPATELTLLPCSQDLENQVPKSVTVQFLVYNEFEERFSASTTVTCYLSTILTDIDAATSPTSSVFSNAVLGTGVAMTEITPVIQPDGTSGGVVGVARVFPFPLASSAAHSLHTTGSFIPPAGPDQIFLAPRE